jgi:hypothetical protein
VFENIVPDEPKMLPRVLERKLALTILSGTVILAPAGISLQHYEIGLLIQCFLDRVAGGSGALRS